MSIVIKAENIGKKYLISHQNEKKTYNTLRETIYDFFSAKNRSRINKEDFWALKEINFEVNQGDKIGIIGRNGAGKSTLLKILSRITEPTTGKVGIKGRVASLLEVGTGFHPELTGRENIFLNGSILGMSHQEIKRKFDEIVDFAGVENFLDTPVKRYSSGMYVRLAFSVASHLESEILIIDEVLAVGDSVFQKKCIDKMLEISNTGRTILFVSHNFSAIKSLCSTAFLLDKGKLNFSGKVQEVIDKYIEEQYSLSGKEVYLSEIERKKYARQIIFDQIIFDEYPISFGKNIKFRVKFKTIKTETKFINLDFGISINDTNNNTIIHCGNRYINKNFDHKSDSNFYTFEIENIIKPGIYYINLFLRSNDIIQDWLENTVQLEITDGNPYNFNDSSQLQGLIFPKFNINLLDYN